jgi:hypothetical protein
MGKTEKQMEAHLLKKYQDKKKYIPIKAAQKIKAAYFKSEKS